MTLSNYLLRYMMELEYVSFVKKVYRREMFLSLVDCFEGVKVGAVGRMYFDAASGNIDHILLPPRLSHA